MPNRYKVTTFDVCVSGFERLRNRDEFILLAYPHPAATADELAEEWIRDIQSCAREDGFDYDSAYACVTAWARDPANVARVRSVCADLEPPDENEESELNAYLYLADSTLRDEHGRLLV